MTKETKRTPMISLEGEPFFEDGVFEVGS